MSITDPWNKTAASDARLNKMTIPTMSGDDIALLDKTKHKIVACNETGSGYTADHIYTWSDDGANEYDMLSLQPHTHTSGDDGGDYWYILENNPEVIQFLLLKPTDLIKANWNQTVTGTGSIEDGGGGSSKPYVRLRPNGTSGSGATISYTFGQNVSFGDQFIFAATGNFETASSLAFHAGVNADDVTVADSNTIKLQAEVCTATNNNWWIRNANGSATSASDTGKAITTNDMSIKLIHDDYATTPFDLIEIDAGSTFTKTTHVATSGSTTTGNIIKFSVKNSTGADRPYRVKGAGLAFITSGSWAYGP